VMGLAWEFGLWGSKMGVKKVVKFRGISTKTDNEAE
jgi:hypothetical protein